MAFETSWPTTNGKGRSLGKQVFCDPECVAHLDPCPGEAKEGAQVARTRVCKTKKGLWWYAICSWFVPSLTLFFLAWKSQTNLKQCEVIFRDHIEKVRKFLGGESVNLNY